MGEKTVSAAVSRAFAEADALQKAAVGPTDVLIRGGRFPASRLDAFLAAWQPAIAAALPWALVEEVSHFHVHWQPTASELAGRAGRINRARVFGPAGDLLLRRDEETIHWRFIGDPGDWPDPQPWNGADFWSGTGTKVLHAQEKAYYQWHVGDDRVGLSWPEGAGLPDRGVVLRQRHYLQQGSVVFERYLTLEAENSEVDNE